MTTLLHTSEGVSPVHEIVENNIIAMQPRVDCAALWEALRARCVSVEDRVRLDIKVAQLEGRFQ